MKKFDREKFIKERNGARKLVYFLIPMTLVLILDIPFPPIPPNINFPLALIFLVLFYIYYSKGFGINNELKEIIFIALKDEYDGYLTIPIISMELDVTIEKAEIITKILEKKGYLTLIKCGSVVGENIYKFVGLKLKKPSSDDIIENAQNN